MRYSRRGAAQEEEDAAQGKEGWKDAGQGGLKAPLRGSDPARGVARGGIGAAGVGSLQSSLQHGMLPGPL